MHETINQIIVFIHQYGYIIIFLGTIIGGELVILAAAFMASLGYLKIHWVLFAGLAGIVLSDSFWYYIGYNFHGSISKFRRLFISSKHQPRIEYWKDQFDDHFVKVIVMSKFIYGTRIMTLITSGYQRIPYRRFIVWNVSSSIIWIVIMILLGYGMGFSWNYLEKYNNYSRYFVLFGLVLLLAIRLVFKRFFSFDKYKIIKRQS